MDAWTQQLFLTTLYIHVPHLVHIILIHRRNSNVVLVMKYQIYCMPPPLQCLFTRASPIADDKRGEGLDTAACTLTLRILIRRE